MPFPASAFSSPFSLNPQRALIQGNTLGSILSPKVIQSQSYSKIFQLVCPNQFSCSNSIPRVLIIKSGIKDTNPFIPSPQMKLIWVLPENRGQNNHFRPNRVEPCVHQSTGDRGVHHHWSAGGVCWFSNRIRMRKRSGKADRV